MKVYKVTLMIIDHDGVGDGIKTELENVRYPNRCLSPKVMDIKEAEIGEWRDEHPLNYGTTVHKEFERLFSPTYEDALAKHIADVDELLDDQKVLDTSHLYDADPNCAHNVILAFGGGVKCTKCRGWFCY